MSHSCPPVTRTATRPDPNRLRRWHGHASVGPYRAPATGDSCGVGAVDVADRAVTQRRRRLRAWWLWRRIILPGQSCSPHRAQTAASGSTVISSTRWTKATCSVRALRWGNTQQDDRAMSGMLTDDDVVLAPPPPQGLLSTVVIGRWVDVVVPRSSSPVRRYKWRKRLWCAGEEGRGWWSTQPSKLWMARRWYADLVQGAKHAHSRHFPSRLRNWSISSALDIDAMLAGSPTGCAGAVSQL